MTPTPLNLYLQDIGRHPPLCAADEVALAKGMEAGCEGCRRLLIEGSLRLVVSVAKRFNIPTMPQMDLINEGNIGLMKAAERYDWRTGNRFSTVAVPHIEEVIKKAITDKGRIIRLPQSQVAKIRRQTADAPVPVPVHIGDAQEMDCFADESGDNGAAANIQEMRPLLSRMLNVLTAREQKVIAARFGTKGHDPEPLRAVGKRMGLCYERIRQIEVEALQKLREAARKLGVEANFD